MKLESYRKSKALDLNGKIRLIGTVISKKDVSRFVSVLLLDDGFGEIRAKIFNKEEIPSLKEGDIVEVFGSVREDERGKFLAVDKVFLRDIYWELYRLLEYSEIEEKFEEKNLGEREKIEEKEKTPEKKEGFETEGLEKEEKIKEKEMKETLEEKDIGRHKREEIVKYLVDLLQKRDSFTIEELYEIFRGSEDVVDSVIEEFKNEGIIFEEKPGLFRRL